MTGPTADGKGGAYGNAYALLFRLDRFVSFATSTGHVDGVPPLVSSGTNRAKNLIRLITIDFCRGKIEVVVVVVDSRLRLRPKKNSNRRRPRRRYRSMIYPGAIYLASLVDGGRGNLRRNGPGSDRGLTFSVSADLRAPATSRNRTGATATTGHL